MKKCLVVSIALCLAFMLAVPAMALETKFSGEYRVRGFHNSNQGLNDNDASDSWMDMRLRVRTDFMVSDNLTVSTRFDALDGKRLGNADHNTGNDQDNIDFDRAWMTIRTDYGIFQAGRMTGGSWGTLFSDTEEERDRIRWHDSFGDLTVLAIFEKRAENDEGPLVNDEDRDYYYLGAYYKMENITAGLLYGYDNDKRGVTFSDKYHLLMPYVIGQFGPFGFQGELRYEGFGERDNDFAKDQDIKRLAYNVEGTFSMDMFQFELGYAYVRGQGSNTSDIRGMASGIGDDWQKLWILTNSEDDGLYSNLGGLGNLSTSGSVNGGPLPTYGAQIYYGGVTLLPMENLDVKFLAGYARANNARGSVKKDYGWEYDLFLNYKIFDNLTYSFIAAYLDAGKFWRSKPNPIDKKDLEDNFHLFHQLSLAF